MHVQAVREDALFQVQCCRVVDRTRNACQTARVSHGLTQPTIQVYLLTCLLTSSVVVLGKNGLITSLLVSHSIVKWVTIIFVRFTISPMQV